MKAALRKARHSTAASQAHKTFATTMCPLSYLLPFEHRWSIATGVRTGLYLGVGGVDADAEHLIEARMAHPRARLHARAHRR